MDRYNKRKIITNSNPFYERRFMDKGVKNISHYSTPRFFYPNVKAMSILTVKKEIWKQGDSFEKISSSYYGNPSYWWIIAHFNQKPTEQHCLVGDTILIPLPLGTILKMLGY